MNEPKIVRFVNIDACKRIFSEHSTFVLGSPEHYHYIEGCRRDTEEGVVKIGNNVDTFHGYLISCWTILKTEKLAEDDWKIFIDKDKDKDKKPNILAFVSTPEKVEKFLKCQLDIRHGNPFFHIEKGKVKYYTQDTQLPDNENFSRICFYKKVCFSKQNEYRFVLFYKADRPHIDYYVFITYEPRKYFDEIIYNHNADPKHKDELFKIKQILNFRELISNREDFEKDFYEAVRQDVC